jgi:hypothetical protein
MLSAVAFFAFRYLNLPALWHPLRGAEVFAALPEVSAITATSGYCLSTLRVASYCDRASAHFAGAEFKSGLGSRADM